MSTPSPVLTCFRLSLWRVNLSNSSLSWCSAALKIARWYGLCVRGIGLRMSGLGSLQSCLAPVLPRTYSFVDYRLYLRLYHSETKKCKGLSIYPLNCQIQRVKQQSLYMPTESQEENLSRGLLGKKFEDCWAEVCQQGWSYKCPQRVYSKTLYAVLGA